MPICRRKSCSVIEPDNNGATALLFVYGTLRKQHLSQYHRAFAKDWQWLCKGYLCGKLYEAGGYPGAVLSENANDRVLGEIYAINDSAATFRRLDTYEECTDSFPKPHEYIRTQHLVYGQNGQAMMAWVYLYNWDTNPLTHIPSGDYLA